MAGWPTPTTRERLNGLLTLLEVPGGFYQRDHDQYLWCPGGRDVPIDSCDIYVIIRDREGGNTWNLFL
jgi:hypothetical protein